VSTPQENILVVRRELFDSLGAFQGFSPEVDRYLPHLLSRENNFFMPRASAENDPSHKQIIPYCVFCHEGKILRYFRGGKSGEKRLVDKGSIGIGGHINDTDEGLFAFDDAAYEAAVQREIAEELRLEGGFRQHPVGLINDDSNEVGRVHLGVVHLVELEKPGVQSGEKAIASPAFLTIEELLQEKEHLETWSQIVVENWAQVA